MYTCSVCNNPTIATSMTMDFIEVNHEYQWNVEHMAKEHEAS
jgi:hypothetical protein